MKSGVSGWPWRGFVGLRPESTYAVKSNKKQEPHRTQVPHAPYAPTTTSVTYVQEHAQVCILSAVFLIKWKKTNILVFLFLF